MTKKDYRKTMAYRLLCGHCERWESKNYDTQTNKPAIAVEYFMEHRQMQAKIYLRGLPNVECPSQPISSTTWLTMRNVADCKYLMNTIRKMVERLDPKCDMLHLVMHIHHHLSKYKMTDYGQWLVRGELERMTTYAWKKGIITHWES